MPFLEDFSVWIGEAGERSKGTPKKTTKMPLPPVTQPKMSIMGILAIVIWIVIILGAILVLR